MQEHLQSFHAATAATVASREWQDGDFIKHHPGWIHVSPVASPDISRSVTLVMLQPSALSTLIFSLISGCHYYKPPCQQLYLEAHQIFLGKLQVRLQKCHAFFSLPVAARAISIYFRLSKVSYLFQSLLSNVTLT